MSTRIYHNPRCSKCRETLALLDNANVEVEIIEYLNTPPSREELVEILAMLDMKPRELMRSHEDEYKENNLADEPLSDDALIDAMLRFPKLIERPIVITMARPSLAVRRLM